jgi:rhodanese-related sulfurtransferase
MKCKICASLFALALFFVSCAQQNTNVKTIAAKAYKLEVEKQGVQILDVRTAGEYQGGHIKNALQANWNDPSEFDKRTQHLDKNTTVYVYCQAGGRSAAAAAYLTEKGYNVVNLEGGMSNWKINNLPVEGNANAIQMRVEDFESVISKNNLVLVDIGATWCPPCRKMIPTVEQIKKEYSSNLYFLSVDGGVDIEVMKHLRFQELPTFIVFKNGKEVWRKVGIVTADEFRKAIN